MFLPLTGLICLSAYGLGLSRQNITLLQQYEAQSEKAAKWSDEVAKRLHKTRTTQTSGTVTLVASLVTAFTLLFRSTGKLYLVSAAGVNVAALFAARTHMARFWNEGNQVQVPFVDKFNKAIKGSEQVVRVLGVLSLAWLGAGAMWSLGITGL